MTKPCTKDFTRPCTLPQNRGRCSTLLFIRSFLDVEVLKISFEVDILELVNASHHHASDTLLRLGSFVLDRSPKEIMDHVTNALVEFVDLDSRREISVHCCMENRRMVWVGPSILLATSCTFLRLVIGNGVLRHRIAVAHHTGIEMRGQGWVGWPLGFFALGSGVGLGWEICVTFPRCPPHPSLLLPIRRIFCVVIVSLGWVARLTHLWELGGLCIFYPGGRGLARTRCLFPVSSPALLTILCVFFAS